MHELFCGRFTGERKEHAGPHDCRKETGVCFKAGRGLFPGGTGLVRVSERGSVSGNPEEVSGNAEGNRGKNIRRRRKEDRLLHEDPD